jgi:GDP-4-dehydro-6-deoxy-D-mannose reductase
VSAAGGDGADFRRILFTGATGFVGHYLAPAILDAFPDANKLILRRQNDIVSHQGWGEIDADLLNLKAIEAAIADYRPDLILHLAAQASVEASVDAAEATWRLNFDGSLALAAACTRHAPDATFFFVSSSEVYGESFRDGAAREDTPLKPMSVYARSKAAAEAMLSDVLRPQARLIIVRPFNHNGPHQDRRFVLPAFAAQIAEIEAGRKIPRLEVGNLDAARDFLDVRDVCAAYVGLLRHSSNLPLRASFNVGSGETRTIRELLDALRGLSRRDFDVAIDPARMRASDIPIALGNSDKLFKATGWKPKIPIADTLHALLDHWREQMRRE